jgi:hypothetical protein
LITLSRSFTYRAGESVRSQHENFELGQLHHPAREWAAEIVVPDIESLQAIAARKFPRQLPLDLIAVEIYRLGNTTSFDGIRESALELVLSHLQDGQVPIYQARWDMATEIVVRYVK